MISKELRIGNLVYYSDQFGQYIDSIRSLKESECQLKNHGAFFTYDGGITPIPLTEEWLLKFGFIHDNGGIYELDLGRKSFRIFTLEDNHCIFRDDVGMDYIEIKSNVKFVHQLQNIYYALIEEELLLKND